MKTKPRSEWNGLPGYLASLRMKGANVEADLKLLDLGFDAKTLREFMSEPIRRIAKKFESKNLEERNKGEDELNELVIKMVLIGVHAERERVAEEERHHERPT